MIQRRLFELVEKDLQRKMVFLAGPRQSGKTTMAKQFLTIIQGRYYNFDLDQDRAELFKSALAADAKLWILDEIHKYSRWRNWLKGLFDHHQDHHQFLITGSAKLDVYSRGGDSLAGRYFFYRFHPFTLGELLSTPIPTTPEEIVENIFGATVFSSEGAAVSKDLLKLGNFPEPFLSGSEIEAQRWRSTYSRRVVREDVRDLESVKDINLVEILYDRLPATVASPLSINSLREDLDVSHESVRRWLEIFDRLYLTFKIPPFGPPKIKAIKKEQKLYLWDWGAIENLGPRIENMVALHLLRFTHWCEDVFGEKVELRYFRIPRKEEVDFVIIRKNKPWIAVEVKKSEQELDSNLCFFLQQCPVKFAFQLHWEGTKDVVLPSVNSTKIRMMPVHRFLEKLP